VVRAILAQVFPIPVSSADGVVTFSTATAIDMSPFRLVGETSFVAPVYIKVARDARVYPSPQPSPTRGGGSKSPPPRRGRGREGVKPALQACKRRLGAALVLLVAPAGHADGAHDVASLDDRQRPAAGHDSPVVRDHQALEPRLASRAGQLAGRLLEAGR